ncbi:MAG: hypothetical protein Cons2KO_34730 [Congregibacter sp.]
MPVIALSLILTLLPLVATAGAEPYGHRFFLSGDERASDPRELSAEPYKPTAESVEALREEVESRELEGGPYAANLPETLGDLARLLELSGRPDEAMQARERALHLLRVNDGLYSPAQEPLVRAMLDSLRAQGDFATLDERYDYFFRLFGAGRPPWSETRWSALLEYLGWQREAVVRELGPSPRDRLYETYRLTEELLDDLRAEMLERSVPWTRFLDLAYAQLALFYLIEERIQPIQDFPIQRGSLPPGDPRGDFDLLQERLENLQRTIRQRGKGLLQEALALIPETERESRAEVLLALGDWSNWQGAQGDARESYLAVWAELEEAMITPASWFSGPVPLPANGVFRVPDAPLLSTYTLNVAVSASGRARAKSASVADSAVPQRLRRQINNTRFRPLMKRGKFLETEWQNLRFSVVDP